MSKDKEHRQISQEEVERYLNGQMSGKEAHAFERFLLDNEFDQEAIEGLEKHPVEQWSTDVKAFKRRLESKGEFKWWTVAAVITFLLLAGLSGWYLYQGSETDTGQLSYLDTGDQTVPLPTEVNPPQIPVRENYQEQVVPKEQSSKQPLALDLQEGSKDPQQARVDLALAEQRIEDEPIVPEEEVIAEDAISVSAVSETAMAFYDEEQEAEVPSLQRSKEKRSSRSMNAAPAAGGAAIREEISKEEAENFERPVPGIGEDAYLEYLEEKLEYPVAASSLGIEGSVYLSVTISETGEVLKSEVLKSLGYGCDEEAIRLVERGPKWLPAKMDGEPVKATLRVEIPFRIKN